ncbi:MAG: cob(I)yrinic acid a,c-diamide adenosyltransferase [bacterium]|nr:cob(I)yrinic acid a,c-diamide adenosyltransferase [bacterium]
MKFVKKKRNKSLRAKRSNPRKTKQRLPALQGEDRPDGRLRPRKDVRQFKTSSKGQTIIYYGDGKGKTTAALGAVLRAAGYGWQCYVYQFIKGPWPSGERVAIPRNLKDYAVIEAGGKGFVGIMGDTLPKEIHKEEAQKLFAKAKERIGYKGQNNVRQVLILGTTKLSPDPRPVMPRLIVLDELLDAIDLGFVSQKEVVQLIKTKPDDVHLIITGHKKFPNIFNAADLVTEMKKVKHPFDKGFLAYKGLDY